ncbi:SGNH/GDSL hydrolase family protein [Pasteurella sp. PK-2025]|uniref:SGNH/GDSL hydrolase family protein n=1 Tax=Pasteurella sp. PK-2025 TaxID=3413133 RepID=UPI003C757955
MLPDRYIFARYQEKRAEFEKHAEVTLIGHSLFDMWALQPNGTPNLAGKSVANLGISGVSTRQYLEVIVEQNCIRQLGQTVFIFLGVNDICKEKQYSPAQVMRWLEQIFQILRQNSPNSTYYLLEATPVNQITTVTNEEIRLLNDYLKTHRPQGLGYIPTQTHFCDEKGNLNPHLCTDGLHFNQAGYGILETLLIPYLT